MIISSLMTWKIYPRLTRSLIKTASSQPSGAKATIIGSRTRFAFVPHAFEGFKAISRTYGFYKDIEPYLPETTLDKYRYKPHKRVYGQIRKTKGFLKNATGYYKYKKRHGFLSRCSGNNSECPYSKGSYYT